MRTARLIGNLKQLVVVQMYVQELSAEVLCLACTYVCDFDFTGQQYLYLVISFACKIV